jgi:alkaline phosphatase
MDMAGGTSGRRGALALALVLGLVVGLVLGLGAFFLTSPDDAGGPRGNDRAPDAFGADIGGVARSVIFINGDGMGAAHREAARLDQQGFDGTLAMDALPVRGSQSTSPADPRQSVTDSAAAASAWATGERTYNGAISVDVDGNPLPTIGAEAKQAGKATGLVTTAQVTDASPAAFFSNTADRGQQDDIARQYLDDSRPDVILGGGEDWWLPAGSPGAVPDDLADDEGSRSAQGDLIAHARQIGYQYVTDAAGLGSADGDKLLGLFANEEMFRHRPEGQGDEYAPAVPLADMTSKALDVLSRDADGFFLFVEEEGVDEMSHANNGVRMLQAMRALEDTVRVATRYVADHPDTLLIVTGDHECGGLSVENLDDSDESGDGRTTSAEDGPFPVAGSDHRFVLDWTTGQHTGAPTPVSAAGPGSQELVGSYPNTRLHAVIREALLG